DVNAFRTTVATAAEGSPGGQIRAFLPDPSAWNQQLSEDELIADLNAVILKREFFDPAAFEEVLQADWKIDRRLAETKDPAERTRLERLQLAEQLATADVSRLSTAQVERRNRLLVEAAFPELVKPHEWNTQVREWSNTAALVGNPNF